MKQINFKDISFNPSNPRAEFVEKIPDILFRSNGQDFEIISGRMRATALADLGSLVPAMSIASSESVFLKRTPNGQWLKATQ